MRRFGFCHIPLPFAWMLLGMMGWMSPRQITAQSDPYDGGTLIAYPLVFYTPETRLGLGATGLFNFRLNSQDSITPPSQVQLTAAYTFNHQFIFNIPFEFYFRERKHTLYGELEYNRFFYNYFGLGASLPALTTERYQTEFPRFRLHYLRRMSVHWYAGFRWWHEHQNILETQPGGLLESSSTPGYRGGHSGGPGLALLYDSRDNVYSSHKGSFAELTWHTQTNYTGSDYDFNRWRLDIRKFIPVGRSHVLAWQTMAESIQGNPPFFQYASLGSGKRLRGYYEGYFREKNMILHQLEWRSHIWKGLGATGFCSGAWMSNRPENLQWREIRWSAGAGLRFQPDPKSRVTLRLDYARGPHSDAVYFTVGEAF